MAIARESSRPAPPQKCGGLPAPLWRGHRTVSTTNSNGGHVMGAVTAVEYKGGQQQKDKSGGYVFQHLRRAYD